MAIKSKEDNAIKARYHNCKQCDEKYRHYYDGSQFCSQECAYEYNSHYVKCSNCGKEKRMPKWDYKRRKIFLCSNKCFKKYWYLKHYRGKNKICSECKIAQSIFSFHKGNDLDKLYSLCKRCTSKKSKQWSMANRERKTKSNKQWKRNNLNKLVIYAQKRRAHKLNAWGSFTQRDIDKIRIKQNDRCYYAQINSHCRVHLNNGGTIDHKIPLDRGGSNRPRNLVLACGSCNYSKHNKTVQEFAEWCKIQANSSSPTWSLPFQSRVNIELFESSKSSLLT